MNKLAALPLALSLVLAGAGNAFATQAHGDPEGYYVHQIAHVIMCAAMVYMLVVLKSPIVFNVRGWRIIRLAALFFLLWNITTFISHAAEESLGGKSAYIQGGRLYFVNSTAAIYYFTRLIENFFLAPAFLLLAVGLHQLWKYLKEETQP